VRKKWRYSSSQLYASVRINPGERDAVSTGQEAGWGLDWAWRQLRTKSPPSHELNTVAQPVSSFYTPKLPWALKLCIVPKNSLATYMNKTHLHPVFQQSPCKSKFSSAIQSGQGTKNAYASSMALIPLWLGKHSIKSISHKCITLTSWIESRLS
jgi:hypothetical protein